MLASSVFSRQRLAPFFALVAVAVPAWALGGVRIVHRPDLRIAAFELPRGWEPAAQIAYPRIVALATNSDGAQLSLAVQQIVPGTGAIPLAADARATLLAQGFGDPRIVPEEDRARLEATAPANRSKGNAGNRQLRQIYIVDGDLAFILTLAAPTARMARLQRDFDDAVRSLAILPWTPPTAAGPDGGAQ